VLHRDRVRLLQAGLSDAIQRRLGAKRKSSRKQKQRRPSSVEAAEAAAAAEAEAEGEAVNYCEEEEAVAGTCLSSGHAGLHRGMRVCRRLQDRSDGRRSSVTRVDMLYQ
jgi:hypothetical protein